MSPQISSEKPAIFYSPHQDDEAIAMGGAINEHVAVGRPVYLVLLTNGRPSKKMRNRLRPKFPGVSEDELIRILVEARNNEFRASAAQLGVPTENIHLIGLNDGVDTSTTHFVAQISSIILGYERQYPGASHKLVSGVLESYGNGVNFTHTACWYAAHSLREWITDFRFYQVYVYGKPMNLRASNFYIASLTPAQFKAKKRALNEYKVWAPPGRLAYGLKSVPNLLSGAVEDPHEYVDVLM